MSTRDLIADAARVVIKVGSSSLAGSDGYLDSSKLRALVDVIGKRRIAGQEIILVSSGAQAAGIGPLGLSVKPKDLAMAQAAAGVGQGLLIAEYTREFGRYGIVVGQVLLTAEDVIRRSHYRNAHRSLNTMLKLGVLPIVNENDAVATAEIRFGDNDRIAALVAHLVKADALVLLTDIDGVYDAPPSSPGARRICDIRSAEDLRTIELAGSGSKVGSGGMVTKVQAATMAASSGIPTILAQAGDAADALAGHDVGTAFAVTGRRMTAKQLWLGYAAAVHGRVVVDDGARRAIMEGQKSLLPVGVVGVEGDFGYGDPIEIVDASGHAIARGISGYSSHRLELVMGRTTEELAAKFGGEQAHEVVHRDELVTHARARRPAILDR